MAAEQPITRLCQKCKLALPLGLFGKDKYRPDGLTCWCKPCRRKSSSTWQAANPERNRGRQKRWRLAHGDKHNQKRNAERAEDLEKFRRKERERYAKNPKIYLDKKKRFDAAHPDYVKRNRTLYYQRHKDDFIAKYVRAYRARKKNAQGHHTNNDIQRILTAQRHRCGYCRAPLRGRYHVDHIIPLSDGGTNWPSNIQLLCGPCNLSKGSRDPLDHARRLGRLL